MQGKKKKQKKKKEENCQTFPSKCQVYLCLISGEHNEFFIWENTFLMLHFFFFTNSIPQVHVY